MSSFRPVLTLGIFALLLAAGILCVFSFVPVDALSGDMARVLVVCAAVLVVLFLTHRRGSKTDRESSAFGAVLAIWWFLLCSEALFPRTNNGADNAAAGRFTLTAYGEAIFWVFLAACFVFVAARSFGRMKAVIQGRLAVAIALVALSTVSVLWAPEPAFSLAWSFKLVLGITLVAYIASSLRSLRDVRTLLIVTFWAFAFLTVVPVVEGTLTSSSAFSGTMYAGEAVVEQGRFHATAHPLVIAGRAGILALLALLFYSLEGKKRMIALAIGCAVLIGLSGAKTAFLAAIISVGLLFSLRRRVMAAFGLVMAFGLLAFLIVSTTAVGSYLQDYLHSGDLMTISGRTDLWSAAWPEITNHLALGHGYAASKLVSIVVGIPWYAGHMHNAILETLYNNGLPGLVLVLTINFLIATDLIVLYRREQRKEVQLLAMSLLALYCFIFLNGLTEPYFGGQASAFYLLFLGLFGVSEWLRVYCAAVLTTKVSHRSPATTPALRLS